MTVREDLAKAYAQNRKYKECLEELRAEAHRCDAKEGKPNLRNGYLIQRITEALTT